MPYSSVERGCIEEVTDTLNWCCKRLYRGGNGCSIAVLREGV